MEQLKQLTEFVKRLDDHCWQTNSESVKVTQGQSRTCGDNWSIKEKRKEDDLQKSLLEENHSRGLCNPENSRDNGKVKSIILWFDSDVI